MSFDLSLMGGRVKYLEAGQRGLEETGKLFVGIGDVVGGIGPVPIVDDPGIYYIVLSLAPLFDLPAASLMSFVLVAIVALGAAVGLCLTAQYFTTWPARTVAAFMIVGMSAIALIVGGVYAVAAPATIVLCSSGLLFSKRSRSLATPSVIGAFLALGFAGEALNIVRSNAATPALVFLAVIVMLHATTKSRLKFILIAALVIGMALPALYIDQLLRNRDTYLTAHVEGYEPMPFVHPGWHSIYIGFGYLEKNPYGIRYKDDVAIERVRQIDPSVFRSERAWDTNWDRYETIIRAEVFQLFLAQPVFFVKTIFAKIGALIPYLLVLANVGLVLAFLRRPNWRLEGAFWPAMVLAALPGIAVMPAANYAMAFLAMSALYGLYHTGRALDDVGLRGLLRIRRPRSIGGRDQSG